MRILACDPIHKYFFIGVDEKELKEIVIPHQEMLLATYRGDRHPHILVSSIETREKELEEQRKIKANPFTRRTIRYSEGIHEVPDFDAYIVVNRDLDELYFVPFDFWAPEKWGMDPPWHKIDKVNISSLAEVLDVPFNYKGKSQEKEFDYTVEDANELMACLMDKIPEWKRKGPKRVFEMVMAEYQLYHLYINELDALLFKGDVHMPLEWWDQDQMHLKTQADFFQKKEEPYRGKRSYEDELMLVEAMKMEGRTSTEVGDQILFDYLDRIITWETLYEFFYGYDIYEELNKMEDSERRRFIWLKRYDEEDMPF